LNPHDEVVQFVHQVAAQVDEDQAVAPAMTNYPPLTASRPPNGFNENKHKKSGIY